jgi:hypothetical protein
MAHHRSAHRSANGCEDLELRVRAADELVRETVVLLCRGRPPGSLGAAARDALTGIRPEVRGALAALEDIEGLRPLTDEELALRRAFTMLLHARTGHAILRRPGPAPAS